VTSTLDADGVAVVRGGRRVLDGASLRLGGGRIATLEGPSGSGKTTLLRVLATLSEPASGVVRLDGIDAREIPPRVYRTRVAYVSQQPTMLDGSVEANVTAGPHLSGELPTADDVSALLGRVGLEEIAGRRALDLSGGEKQRVALARALANRPEVLLLDEPTAALDPSWVARIVALVRALADGGLAVIAVTHIEEHAAALGGDRYRMLAGHVVRHGASRP
jgi:ABC-type multidrug transport system ATPase subunit